MSERGTTVEPGEESRPPLFSRALETYATNLAAAVLSFGNVLVVARALGASGRGDVAFLTTIGYLLASAAALGIEQANANVAGREPARRPQLATNSVLLAALFGAGAAGLAGAVMAAFPAVGGETSVGLRVLVLVFVPLLVLQIYLQLLLQAEYAFRLTNATWLLPPLVNVAVNGILAAAGALSVTAAVATWLAGQALGVAVLAWYALRRSAGFGRPDPALARRSLAFGVKAHAGRVLTLGNYRIDQWILGAVAGSRELGHYSVAVVWAEVLFYLPTALTLVQRPDLVRAERGEAARLAALGVRAALLVTLVGAALIVLLAPVLVVVAFGDEFRPAVDDLRVLAPGAVGIVLLKLLGNALTAQGRPLVAAGSVAVAFAVTLALDAVLIPDHGGLGAAVAATIAYTAGGAAVAVAFARTLGGRLPDLLPRGSEARWLWRRLRRRERGPRVEPDAVASPPGGLDL
jgi:O-antigen/teichoic acid export membrane protein